MQPEQGGIRTWQWVVTVIVIIALILVGYYMYKGSTKTTSMTDDTTVATDDSSFAAGKDVNRVVVTDQFPGNIVYLSSVQLKNPGFVVVQKDNKGKPGDVIGSQYFDKGINPGKITLKSSTVEGNIYYAVIYSDNNGNKTFDAGVDMPLKDAAGNMILKIFRVTSTVTEVKG